MNLKQALKDKLTKDELAQVQKAYEVIGDIAIVDIVPELEARKKLIAETLVQINPQIKVVLRQKSKVTGTERIAGYETLLGDRTETIHKESYCRFKIDLTRVYFTSKLAGERQRIADQVKGGEEILCMFAGVGPYPIVIAKNKNAKIWAVEINKDACRYMEENILLNNVYGKIFVLRGDVKKIVPRLIREGKKFDRILMPAPKSAEDFLDAALPAAKRGAIVHFYAFAGEEEMADLQKKLVARCKKLGKKIKIMLVQKCGAFAPRVWRVVIDFKVL